MGTGLQYQDIEKRSYMIWERQGRPHGHDLEHWLQAERELAAENGGSTKSPAMMMESKIAAPRKRKAPMKKPTLAN